MRNRFYHPPQRRGHSGLHAIDNSKPMRESEVQRIMVLIRLSYEKLKAGHGTDADFSRIAAVINVGLIRAESIHPELVQDFNSAGTAVLECSRIRQRHGKFGFTGPHILAMNTALDMYGQILAASSPNQMDEALQEAMRRIRRGEYQEA